MSINHCTYQGDRDEAIIAHVYNETDGREHAAFAAHVALCPACRDEIAALGGARRLLAEWVPPEPSRGGFGALRTGARRSRASWPALRAVPAWAQVAAAVLCLGVAAGIANIKVVSSSNGVTITTGWLDRASTSASPQPEGVAPSNPAPWRDDIDLLGRQLRAELGAAANAAPPAAVGRPDDEAELMRRVRTLLEDSEKRQQRELALRLADAFQEVQSQRHADLRRMERSLGVLESSSWLYMQRQGQAINDLAVRVSQGR
jgi:hypothetical protein